MKKYYDDISRIINEYRNRIYVKEINNITIYFFAVKDDIFSSKVYVGWLSGSNAVDIPGAVHFVEHVLTYNVRRLLAKEFRGEFNSLIKIRGKTGYTDMMLYISIPSIIFLKQHHMDVIFQKIFSIIYSSRHHLAINEETIYKIRDTIESEILSCSYPIDYAMEAFGNVSILGSLEDLTTINGSLLQHLLVRNMQYKPVIFCTGIYDIVEYIENSLRNISIISHNKVSVLRSLRPSTNIIKSSCPENYIVIPIENDLYKIYALLLSSIRYMGTISHWFRSKGYNIYNIDFKVLKDPLLKGPIFLLVRFVSKKPLETFRKIIDDISSCKLVDFIKNYDVHLLKILWLEKYGNLCNNIPATLKIMHFNNKDIDWFGFLCYLSKKIDRNYYIAILNSLRTK